MHYPSHKREAFLQLIDSWGDEPPATATMEVNYEPTEIPTEEFLRDFLNCDDQLPRQYTDEFTDGDGEVLAWTYAEAAHRLLEELGGAPDTSAHSIAEAVDQHIKFIEYARQEVERAKRQHRRVGPELRRRAAADIGELRQLADAIRSGTVEPRTDEVEVTIYFDLMSGDEQIGRFSASGPVDEFGEADLQDMLEQGGLWVDDVWFEKRGWLVNGRGKSVESPG